MEYLTIPSYAAGMQEQRPHETRRRRVTPTLLVEVGIELTLAKLTVKAIADRLGVSIVAVYNNIDNLDTLKTAVAEAILARWVLPMPRDDESVERSLTVLSDAARDLVHENPGIAQYMADLNEDSGLLVRINALQKAFAAIHELTPKQTSWAVVTVVEHAISLAELVHVAGGRAGTAREPPKKDGDLDFIAQAYGNKTHTEDDYWTWSMRAVIVGAITLIHDPQFEHI